VTRALGPRPSAAHGAAGPWAVLICCWGVIATGAVGWAGVKTATVISGGTTARFDVKFFENLAAGRTSQVWQHTPSIDVAACVAAAYVLGGVAVLGGWVLLSRRRGVPGDPVAALAGGAQMSALAGPAVARRAGRLRASLRGIPVRSIADDDIGLVLGELTRPRRQRACPVRELGGHRRGVHGAPVREDDRRGDPVSAVSARAGGGHVQQG
jgi:hypothetical protein